MTFIYKNMSLTYKLMTMILCGYSVVIHKAGREVANSKLSPSFYACHSQKAAKL